MSPTKRKRKWKPKVEPKIELRPDGWARFEAAVGAAIKSGPKHRTASKMMATKTKAQTKRR